MTTNVFIFVRSSLTWTAAYKSPPSRSIPSSNPKRLSAKSLNSTEVVKLAHLFCDALKRKASLKFRRCPRKTPWKTWKDWVSIAVGAREQCKSTKRDWSAATGPLLYLRTIGSLKWGINYHWWVGSPFTTGWVLLNANINNKTTLVAALFLHAKGRIMLRINILKSMRLSDSGLRARNRICLLYQRLVLSFSHFCLDGQCPFLQARAPAQ